MYASTYCDRQIRIPTYRLRCTYTVKFNALICLLSSSTFSLQFEKKKSKQNNTPHVWHSVFVKIFLSDQRLFFIQVSAVHLDDFDKIRPVFLLLTLPCCIGWYLTPLRYKSMRAIRTIGLIRIFFSTFGIHKHPSPPLRVLRNPLLASSRQIRSSSFHTARAYYARSETFYFSFHSLLCPGA